MTPRTGRPSPRAAAHAPSAPTAQAAAAGRSPEVARRILSVLPFGVMALVVVVDVTAGSGVGLLPLISLGPAFSGLVGGWRRTLAVGLLSLLLCAALGWYDGLLDSRRAYTALASVAGVTAAGLLASVSRLRRERELASVRSIAEVAQRVLLRPVPRHAGHLTTAVAYTSAVAEARIGGDLYEVTTVPDGVRVIIGDVQGKGLEAVETAAVVLGAFREAAPEEALLTEVGARVERAMERELNGEKFVTALLVDISPQDGATFLNYGHPPPMWVPSHGEPVFPEPEEFALPLGLTAHGMEGPKPFHVDFGPGDQILLYTDGVTEARDADGTFYPLGERAGLLADADPERALAALRADVERHVDGPLHDDAATLLLRHRS